MNPSNISISDYQYQLPEELIAKYPLAARDASRLLVYKNGAIGEDTYLNLYRLVSPRSLLIVNNTKVVAARILFHKSTGGVVEIFCLEPAGETKDVQLSLLEKGHVEWKCLVGGASKWKKGQVLQKELDNGVRMEARYLQKENDSFVIRLSWSPDTFSFAEILQFAGDIPLPPYLKRAAVREDVERYQTIFAHHNGSVAAPTAGLHFTENVLSALKETGIEIAPVTLHVGAGTFLPVKTNTIGEHTMHAEWLHLSRVTLQKLIEKTGQIAAVGTTSLRTLESLYHLGIKILENPDIQSADLHLTQWEAYQSSREIPTAAAVSAIINWMEKNKLTEMIARTQLIIVPGYRFRLVDTLITNFHQSHSTLLLLVAAFIGEDWKKIYEYAVAKQFRFLSYGDGCLLFRNKNLAQ